MQHLSIKDLMKNKEDYGGKEVTVVGWARTIRASKSLGFIDLNDGTYFNNLQIVFEEESVSNFLEIGKQNVGASFLIKGLIVLTPEAKQPLELKASEITVVGTSTPDFPLQKKRHSLEFLRSIAHLRPRTNLFAATFRVRSEAAYAVHSFFHEKGFVYAHTPLITASDGEGAGEMFRVTTLDPINPPLTKEGGADFGKDFFGKLTGLTVTGQLEGEAMAMGFGNIYTFGPTFRAENSHTTKHAAEFWMIEPEMMFVELLEMLGVAEDMVKYIIRHILNTCPNEMDFFDSFVEKGIKNRLTKVLESDFGRVTYTDAVEKLIPFNEKFDEKVSWGIDFGSEHERFLSENIYEKPVFVTDYPKDIKAFYMKQNEDGKTVAAMDLLIPGIGELIGGSEREADLEKLVATMNERGMDTKEYHWYLDLRKYGSAPHSGFGLGFERLIMYLTGVQNIRDVLPFPRTPGSAEF